LTLLPSMHALLAGAMDYRGSTVPVIDLVRAMGHEPIADTSAAHVIVCEFSRTVQAMLVRDVDRIVHVDGATLEAPGSSFGGAARVSAVTRLDGVLLAIADVEQILAEVSECAAGPAVQVPRAELPSDGRAERVLVVDDSGVARRNVVELLDQMGLTSVIAHDGREAFAWLDAHRDEPVSLVISDIEMPGLDGYALCRAIRDDEQLRSLKVVLHTSLSGVFNEAMVQRVGADRFIPKFQPEVLAAAILELIGAK